MLATLTLAVATGLAMVGAGTAVAKVAEVYVETDTSGGRWEKVGVYAPSRAHLAARKLCRSEPLDGQPVVATRVVGPPSGGQSETVYDCRELRGDDEK